MLIEHLEWLALPIGIFGFLTGIALIIWAINR